MKLSDLNSHTKAEIRAMPVRRLAGLVAKAKRYYHEKGKSPISDALYDFLEDVLRKKDPDNAVLNTVGAKVATKRGRKKVKLPHPMYSLDKIKPTDQKKLDKWKKANPGPYVGSDKEDGLSLQIQYVKGKPASAYTRGDGTIGMDVSHLLPYLKIPKNAKGRTFTVRAEIAMTEEKFQSLVKDEDKNARNYVAGLTNRLNADFSVLKHADVLAYEIIEPRMKPSKAFAALKGMGFTVAPYRLITEAQLTMANLSKLLGNARKKTKHAIDGYVIERDAINNRPPAGTHHPGYAFAFKEQGEDAVKRVRVEAVEWEESKHGRIIPRIIIPKTQISGVGVTAASGHNAYFIVHGYRYKDRKKGLPIRPIGPGAVIDIIRSGEVIPHVVEVVKPAKKPGLPKVPYQWDATGVNIKLEGTSDKVRDKRISAFFTTIGVEGIKLSTVEKLAGAGLTSIVKILRAGVEDFLEIPGFKERSAQKLYDGIKAKTKAVDLPTLMDASGYFGMGFGTRRATLVVDAYPDLLQKWEKLTPAQITAKVTSIHGFQSKTAKLVGDNFHKFTKWLRLTKIKPVLPKKVKQVGSKLSGKSVCFTGFRDKALEQQIIAQGGTIASGVNKNTSILVYAEGKSSSKTDKAEALGIETYTASEFKRKYKL